MKVNQLPTADPLFAEEEEEDEEEDDFFGLGTLGDQASAFPN